MTSKRLGKISDNSYALRREELLSRVNQLRLRAIKAMSKSPITCHVLDSSTGQPARGVEIRLQEYHPATIDGDLECFKHLAIGQTDTNGRCMTLLSPQHDMKAGLYKIVFETKVYFESSGRQSFYPWVEITFDVINTDEHYHVPLLISPFSYTTYRGS